MVQHKHSAGRQGQRGKAMKQTFRGNKFTATFTDENGYYSLTGHVYGASGAVGAQLVELDSLFAPLELLHLCDVETGAPMHAWANAEYYARQGQNGAAAAALHLDVENKQELVLVQSFIDELLQGTPEALEEIKANIAHIWEERIFDLDDDIEQLADKYAPENRPEFVEPLYEDEKTGDMLLLPAYEGIDDDELDRRTALARHLDCNINVVNPIRYSETEFKAEGKIWLVLTEEEAEEAARESVRSYIDDALDIPENIRPYFDEGRFIDDVLRADGRGPVLNSWDGTEYDTHGVDNENRKTFFIYRR